MNTGRAAALPRSPAMSTVAQAVPSGNGSRPCSLMVSSWRSGIIIRIPSSPAVAAIRKMRNPLGSKPRKSSAGTVKTMPAANESPAEPIVCTTLFSNTVPRLKTPRSTAIDSTAAGIDAEVVSPTLRPR